MEIYFELSVAGLRGHLISGMNPVGLVCPGSWRWALSGWSGGVFIKREESGGNRRRRLLLCSCRGTGDGEVSENLRSRGV